MSRRTARTGLRPRAGGRVALLAAAGLLVACAGEEAAPTPTGTTWRWVERVGSEPVRVAAPGRYTLELAAEGRYALRADCNRGAGRYELEGSALRLSPAALTRAACPPGSLGDSFARSLGRVVGYSLEDDRLVLELAEGAGSLVLAAQGERPLADTSWLVRAVDNGREGAESVARGTVLTATFGADSRLSGHAGCNSFSADYDGNGGALRIGRATATRIECPRPLGVMEQEAEYLVALQGVTHYEIRGDRLQLRTAEGSLAVDLVSAITGRVSDGESSPLPPDSRVRVWLQDAADPPGEGSRRGEQVLPAHGRQLPISFEVPFDYTEVDPQREYAVRAVVEAPDGSPLYHTPEGIPVLTGGHPTFDVQLHLEPAG